MHVPSVVQPSSLLETRALRHAEVCRVSQPPPDLQSLLQELEGVSNGFASDYNGQIRCKVLPELGGRGPLTYNSAVHGKETPPEKDQVSGTYYLVLLARIELNPK